MTNVNKKMHASLLNKDNPLTPKIPYCFNLFHLFIENSFLPTVSVVDVNICFFRK